VEALLTHAIKVQFPDLHEQFRNKRALTIMASKLDEVLEIEAADSYIKRPAGPMVTIEVKDIAKLTGFIRIPTMAEGTAFTYTIKQKILYSGLPNQCRKCRRFGHQARTCNIVRNSVQEGVAHKVPVPREADNKHPRTRPSAEVAPRVREQSSSTVPRHEAQAPGTYQGGATSKLPRNRSSAPSPGEGPSKTRPSNQSSNPEQRWASAGVQETRRAADPTPLPGRAKEGTQANGRKPPEGATTPKNSIFFELPEPDCPTAQKPKRCANPFASPGDGKQEGDARHRNQEDMLEGWSFQGRRKHAPKIVSPRSDPKQVPTRTPQQEPPSSRKRQQFHSEVHHSYFSSLGIDIPSNGEPFRTRIWPVLTREKNSSKETLVYSKNQARPSLPLNLRIMGPTEAKWTQESAWADLIQRLETELEEKILRYKLSIKTGPLLEWSWLKENSRGGT